MKVYLRDAKTGAYYCSSKAWAPDRLEARNFERVENAAELVRGRGLEGMEIILAYDHPACDLVLPQRTQGA